MGGALFGWCCRLGMNTFRILAPTGPEDAGWFISHIAIPPQIPGSGICLHAEGRVGAAFAREDRTFGRACRSCCRGKMVRGACAGARTSDVSLGEPAVLSSDRPPQTVQHHHVLPDSLHWLAGWPELQVDTVPDCTRAHFADVPSPRQAQACPLVAWSMAEWHAWRLACTSQCGHT